MKTKPDRGKSRGFLCGERKNFRLSKTGVLAAVCRCGKRRERRGDVKEKIKLLAGGNRQENVWAQTVCVSAAGRTKAFGSSEKESYKDHTKNARKTAV